MAKTIDGLDGVVVAETELSDVDGEWYITDHRLDVINSEWFQHRNQ